MIVEQHAQNIKKYAALPRNKRAKKQTKNIIIAESDGSMIPLVTVNRRIKGDRRKTRQTKWREARLSLAYEQGSVTTYYQATLGSTDQAGNQLAAVVQEAGQGKDTHIHCVGDGALWISEQVERIFGDNARYLIDFFHLSQYLNEAAHCCSREPKNWFHEQQKLMKENKIDRVIQNLESHLNDKQRTNHNCGAKKCYQYMIKRMHQFDYKDALDRGLPIGSGEVESAHRTVVQKRLKIPGAWWLEENAEKMLAMRTARANNVWQSYWDSYKIRQYEPELLYQHF
jgi:Uncharacterised protein family (UPF0236)